MLWQRFLLDLCSEQVVSARACANQFLPCSSSGIAIFGMRTVQADSCLNYEQIDILFISVGGQGGGLGGGGAFWAGGPEFTRVCHVFFGGYYMNASAKCFISSCLILFLALFIFHTIDGSPASYGFLTCSNYCPAEPC